MGRFFFCNHEKAHVMLRNGVCLYVCVLFLFFIIFCSTPSPRAVIYPKWNQFGEEFDGGQPANP